MRRSGSAFKIKKMMNEIKGSAIVLSFFFFFCPERWGVRKYIFICCLCTTS